MTWTKKQRYFHKIYEQINASKGIPIYEIADSVHMSRNTVSKYLLEMYENEVLMGPQIKVLPSSDYREYVYLMNFRNPFHFFRNVKGFPHVLYHAMTFGDWNSLVITDRLIDFSHIVGYEKTVFQEMRYHSCTPKTKYVLWAQSFEKCSQHIATFSPHKERKNRSVAPALAWGEDQWKMYHAFKDNTRKTATTTLKEIGVRYESYVTWAEDLDTHCSVHTGFYPEGYPTYTTYCFLFSTDYEQTVREIFSHFPTTPFIMEVGNHLMVLMSVALPGIKRQLFCSIYDMRTQEIIETFSHASFLFHSSL
jgi:hypothetical protein